MKKLTLLALLLSLVLVFSGCVAVSFQGASMMMIRGEGEILRHTESLSDFTKVIVSGNFKFSYKNGTDNSVEFNMYENFYDYLEYKVSGDTLYVTPSATYSGAAEAELIVTAPSLSEIHVSGAVEFSPSDPVSGDSLHLWIAGAASGELAVDTAELNCNISGASDMTLSGAADHLELDAAGAVTIDAVSLTAKTGKVIISGTGDAVVNCSDTLEVNISGMGSCEYVGSPDVSQNISGVGSVSAYKD